MIEAAYSHSVLSGGLSPALLVGVGGAAGALTRFGIGELVGLDHFPISVMVVNAIGTFLATLLVLLAPGRDAVLVASVGFCGSLTTFSTFSVRTVTLWREDRPLAAGTFALGTLLASLFGVGLAVVLVKLV
ncbi:CrcB family protein [Salinarchaeum sp. Harcht-Bsk1]|uniref:fluoride efflux transporter FluC n=1 Tax=Salinarchaeum sp. Harcht-Bsk1 TaxID=1333523 RepID=UPI000677FFD3|nr:CrcB family protein [Salinarchaeum sp. Harcht-Bsk1]